MRFCSLSAQCLLGEVFSRLQFWFKIKRMYCSKQQHKSWNSFVDLKILPFNNLKMFSKPFCHLETILSSSRNFSGPRLNRTVDTRNTRRLKISSITSSEHQLFLYLHLHSFLCLHLHLLFLAHLLHTKNADAPHLFNLYPPLSD